MVRIASLLPSTSEMVYALGMGDALVARSHECDYPSEVLRLPFVTAPKFNPDGRSEEIDQRVKTILQEATSVYRVDAELLRTLAPDVILTQMQCEVCAVSVEEVRRVARDYLNLPANIVALEPNFLADVWQDIQTVADQLGVPQRGETLLTSLRQRLITLAQHTQGLSRPRIATLEWLAPLMSAGNWIPELIDIAGGTNLFGTSGEHSPWLSWHDLTNADPDQIILMPCGFDMTRTLTELAALTTNPAWATLRAVQTGQVYVTDGNAYFNRPGPRLVESAEILAEIMHPDHCHFGHEGIGWQRLAYTQTSVLPADVQ